MTNVAAIDNFRQNLRTAMQARAITQTKLAAKLETSGPYVNDVLQGRTCPSLEQCDRMARAAGFPLGALLIPPKEFSETVLTGSI